MNGIKAYYIVEAKTNKPLVGPLETRQEARNLKRGRKEKIVQLKVAKFVR